MNKIKFYKPNEIDDFVPFCKLLNPDKMLKDLVKYNELDKITDNYSNDVYNLCHNSVGWIIKQLKDTTYFYDIMIMSGTFDGKDHSWIKVGNYYVDLTLSQFIVCPKLAITSIKDNFGYSIDEELSPFEWLGKQVQEQDLISFKEKIRIDEKIEQNIRG